MALTPEHITEQFIGFVKGESIPTPPYTAFHHTFWQTEIAALFGDQEMVRNIQNLLRDACRTRGITGMKAEFLHNLFQNTEAAKIGGGGMKVILEEIIGFKPQETTK